MQGWYWLVIIGGASILIVAALLGLTHRSITGWLRKPSSRARLDTDPASFAAPLPLDVTHEVDAKTARELAEEQDRSAARSRA